MKTTRLSPNAGADLHLRGAAKRMAMLSELAQIGMDMARALQQRARTGEAPDGLAADHARISRAVRVTLMLRERVEREALAEAARTRSQGAWSLEPRPPRGRGQARKSAAHAIVEDLIEARSRAGRGIDAARLRAALRARLTDDRDAEGYADAPMVALVARICRELGAPLDPGAWSADDWVADAVPGAPLDGRTG